MQLGDLYRCPRQYRSPVLPPDERRALAEAMFRDVLGAAMGAKAAWFKDSEGNILAIIQDVRP